MTPTIDDIKRLVPEAKCLGTYFDGSVAVEWGDREIFSDEPWFQDFLTTRAEVERLMGALEEIEGKSHTDKYGTRMSVVLAPSHAVEMVNIARQALEKGE